MKNYNNQLTLPYYISTLVKQLITPKPCPIRGKPFPLGGNDEWFIYPHGKSVYLYNLKDQTVIDNIYTYKQYPHPHTLQ